MLALGGESYGIAIVLTNSRATYDLESPKLAKVLKARSIFGSDERMTAHGNMAADYA